MAENHFAPTTVAVYGVSLLMPAVAYFILTRALLAEHGPDSTLGRALGADVKGKVSILLYVLAVVLTWVDQRLSLAIFVLVALMWFALDPRIERIIAKKNGDARTG